MMFRLIRYLLLSVFILILALVVLILLPSLWRRFITYPRYEKQRIEFISLKQETPAYVGLKTYKGIMHSHSYWSHDSEGTIYDLVTASKQAGIDFIFLTDHPRSDADTLPRGINGYFDGVLIAPGSEKEGFTVWALDSTIIDWSEDRDSIAKNIAKKGDIVFYAHTEEPHNWANPWYQGMEIYNFHADIKDESLIPILVNLLVNKKYGNWAFRHVFDEQASILALWDSLNLKRKIVGSSAADIHENQNLRARYLSDGRVEWIGPDANVIDTGRVHFWNKWLFSKPDQNGWIFKLMLDTYSVGFSHVTNYIYADTLTVPSLSDHIKKGHLFTTFRYLADPDGFLFYCEDQKDSLSGIMGDSVSLGDVKILKAISPYPGQFRLVHNGKTIDTSPEGTYSYSYENIKEKGAYRLEMYIRHGRRLLPWIYTNPVYFY